MKTLDKRRSKEHNVGILPLISSSKVWFMDNAVADSLSSAVLEVKTSGFVLKIRSLRGAMCEFDGTENRI